MISFTADKDMPTKIYPEIKINLSLLKDLKTLTLSACYAINTRLMKHLFIVFLFLLSSCIGQKEVNCENLICTQEFRTITVKFVDADGNPVDVNNFTAINTRTQKSVNDGNRGGELQIKGVYVITSDANLLEFTTNGDIVTVSARHASTGAVKEAEYKITGGKCSCHVAKISGPDEIVFD